MESTEEFDMASLDRSAVAIKAVKLSLASVVRTGSECCQKKMRTGGRVCSLGRDDAAGSLRKEAEGDNKSQKVDRLSMVIVMVVVGSVEYVLS